MSLTDPHAAERLVQPRLSNLALTVQHILNAVCQCYEFGNTGIVNLDSVYTFARVYGNFQLFIQSRTSKSDGAEGDGTDGELRYDVTKPLVMILEGLRVIRVVDESLDSATGQCSPDVSFQLFELSGGKVKKASTTVRGI